MLHVLVAGALGDARNDLRAANAGLREEERRPVFQKLLQASGTESEEEIVSRARRRPPTPTRLEGVTHASLN